MLTRFLSIADGAYDDIVVWGPALMSASMEKAGIEPVPLTAIVIGASLAWITNGVSLSGDASKGSPCLRS